MNLGRIAEQILAGGAACQAPGTFSVALVLYTVAFVTYLSVCVLLWQKPGRSRFENLVLVVLVLIAAFYANNLAAAFACQQIEVPYTDVALVLALLQLLAICALVPLMRHAVFERILPAAAADPWWQVRNYLPASTWFLAGAAVFWLRPSPWPESAGYVFTGFNVPGILYFVPGCYRPYRAYRRQPHLFFDRAWQRLIWASLLTLPALLMVALSALLVETAEIKVAVGLLLKLVFAVPGLIMIHSILRYGFLDIVLRRSLLYGIVGIELLGVYLILTFLVRQSPLGDLTAAAPALSVLSTLGLAAVLAGAIKPLREQCERLLDLTLFRSSTDFRRRLIDLAQQLPRTADAQAVVTAVANGLTPTLSVSGASLGLTFRQRWLAAAAGALSAPTPEDCVAVRYLVAGKGPVDVSELSDAELSRRLHFQGVDLIVPIEMERTDGGVMMLGRKPSGAVFLGEERAFLEAFAGQVTAALEHSQLLAEHLEMGRELARAEQLAAVGNLAARLAHEIRNPLTAVKSLSQLIERDPTAPENAEHLRMVGEELDRVERRVSALLRLTRREEFHLEPVDAGELVRNLLDGMHGRLADSGVDLALAELPSALVHADAEKLRQVLINLIQNAVEAMNGAADKRLAVQLAAGDHGAIAIRIADRGAGISPDDEAHIFEPFYTTKEHGTGLGLAISKRIVEAHHGQLTAAPNPEGGTIFTIELPLIRRTDGARRSA